MTATDSPDVIIIGGSYAGLSAAMALGRSLRNVLVIDSGRPCNEQTPHSHNFLTMDGETPASIVARAKEQVLKYPTVRFLHDFATSGEKSDTGFIIHTQAGHRFAARKLLFATGIRDLLPPVQGLAECWGITIIHCPYCHGYEFRNQPTGIIANGDRAAHLVSLVHNLTKDLTVFTNGAASFTAEQMTRFSRNKIKIAEEPISAIEHEQGHIKELVLAGGTRIALTAVYLAAPFAQHSDIPVSLGCELNEQGYIKVDAMQKTSVDGVFACGDNSGMMRSLANATATGSLAGAAINAVLCAESF